VSYGYALDLSAGPSSSIWSCIRQSGYNVVFIRGYSPTGQGQLDPYVCANIQNANAGMQTSIIRLKQKKRLNDCLAGIGTEVYMTPVPTSTKTGAQQFDEMYGGLKNANINVRSVWIQVTSPTNWYTNSTTNINFLNSILSRASQYGLSIGIYTSNYDWYHITGEATINNAALWYWFVYGDGTRNQSPANYDDFRAFGGWTTPMAKQFGQDEIVCGVTVNRDVYTLSAASNAAGMAKYENSEQVVVGSLGLGNP
ncbi:hypothetical protein OESDEN_24326, partial [Oesophagostomum dentatum]